MDAAGRILERPQAWLKEGRRVETHSAKPGGLLPHGLHSWCCALDREHRRQETSRRHGNGSRRHHHAKSFREMGIFVHSDRVLDRLRFPAISRSCSLEFRVREIEASDGCVQSNTHERTRNNKQQAMQQAKRPHRASTPSRAYKFYDLA